MTRRIKTADKFCHRFDAPRNSHLTFFVSFAPLCVETCRVSSLLGVFPAIPRAFAKLRKTFHTCEKIFSAAKCPKSLNFPVSPRNFCAKPFAVFELNICAVPPQVREIVELFRFRDFGIGPALLLGSRRTCGNTPTGVHGLPGGQTT